ncbi:MAG TPA: hypothetical protein VGN88_02070, partial [Phycisphaerae bacterium]
MSNSRVELFSKTCPLKTEAVNRRRPKWNRPTSRYRRFLLEQLEPRTLLTVVIHSAFGGDTIYWANNNAAGQPGGKVVTGPISNNPGALQDPKVYLIFWGTTWTPSNAQIIANDTQTIINSSFLSGLTDYGSDGIAQYGGYTVDNSVAPTEGGVNAVTEI